MYLFQTKCLTISSFSQYSCSFLNSINLFHFIHHTISFFLFLCFAARHDSDIEDAWIACRASFSQMKQQVMPSIKIYSQALSFSVCTFGIVPSECDRSSCPHTAFATSGSSFGWTMTQLSHDTFRQQDPLSRLHTNAAAESHASDVAMRGASLSL